MKQLVDKNLLKTSSYINGGWHKSQLHFHVLNPANNQQIAQVADASVADTELAISSAKLALSSWQKKSVNQRAEILKCWHRLVVENRDDLARLLTLEQGKPLSEAVGEIDYGASYIEWFSEEAKRAYGDIIPAPSSDKRIVVIKQGVGVVTAITPWNFPNAMIVRKAAAALAAGCTFVVRPSELTPLSALALAELADRAGIPAGVFNVVVGVDAPAMGKILTQHPDVDKVSFTGSTAIGKLLARQCADSVKKISLELGGNAPFIVFEDADIDEAVKGAILAKFRNAGQTCVCANRFFIHRHIAAQFTEKFIAAIDMLTVGRGIDNVNIGPLIDSKAVNKVNSIVNNALKQGAELAYKSQATISGDVDNACFVQPQVLTGITHDMNICQEEIFGPIVSLITFDEEDDVITLANKTEYGLAAYFYSQNINRVWRVAESLNFGMVGINEGGISNAAAPFGGVKQSGYGREGSKYGLDDYLVTKYLCIGGIV